MIKRLGVAVGILVNADGQLLVQQRGAGTECAGYWEFPGGKVEQGETPQQALQRELREELGIELAAMQDLTVLDHDYDHANVRLHTFICESWEGNPLGVEGQTIVWAESTAISELDLLEAAIPLLEMAIEELNKVS